MAFWDRFVLTLCFGLGTHLPKGRDAARRILERALGRRRLTLATLNDTSLLLLLALLPQASPQRPAVTGLATSRRLERQPATAAHLLQAAVPPRLSELVEMSRPP